MKDLSTPSTAVRWRYLLNVPGWAYPLRTPEEMVDILRVYNGSNDIEGLAAERVTYSHFRKVILQNINFEFAKLNFWQSKRIYEILYTCGLRAWSVELKTKRDRLQSGPVVCIGVPRQSNPIQWELTDPRPRPLCPYIDQIGTRTHNLTYLHYDLHVRLYRHENKFKFLITPEFISERFLLRLRVVDTAETKMLQAVEACQASWWSLRRLGDHCTVHTPNRLKR